MLKRSFIQSLNPIFLFCFVLPLSADSLYWAANTGNGGTTSIIGTANLDGSNQATVYSSTRWFAPRDIAIDRSTNELFAIDPAFHQIERMNLNGTSEQVIPASGVLNGITVDSIAGKIYWTDGSAGDIFRANLDGSNQETVLSGLNHYSGISWNMGGPAQIALDSVNGKIYWSSQFEHTIRSANLDGTGQQVVLAGLNEPTDIGVDASNGKIYWTDWDGTIHVADLDGSGARTLVNATPELPYGNTRLALDFNDDKLYWSNFAMGSIWSANLDGSNSQQVLGGVDYLWDIALDAADAPQSSAPEPASIPEPATFGFAVCGLALALRAWRRSQKS